MSIDNLPPELLEVIFLHCLNALNAFPTTTTDAPLNLSRTCARWRDVASGIPSLWSTLRVSASHAASSPPVEVVEKWMHLSGACSLSLSLVCQRRPETSVNDCASSEHGVSRVLELFLFNMYRWRDVTFDFSRRAPPIDYPPSLTAQGAPQLESLEIHPFLWSPLLRELPVPWLAAAVASAPLLHSFTSQFGKIPRACFAQIPWGQLTFLRLEIQLSEFACLFILQSAPRLVECHLLGVRHELFDVLPTFDPLLPAVLPDLVTFGLSSQVGFDRLFRILQAPALRTLEITTRSTHMRWDHAQFMAFLRRSACSITSLTIRDIFISRFTEPELYELLHHVSHSLTELAITSDIPGMPVAIPNTLLRELAYRPSNTGQVLCPQLERLVLQIGALTTDGELAGMLESRWAGHLTAPARIARLEYVDVVCSTDTHSGDLRRLNALLERGLSGRVRVANGAQDAEKDT
ncbi:hypothetical protein B0H11DRAFT_2024219 [Mycena galericulata]|nr:hypothetical protein B0H11DRAFT_2024219 [Mycena galericulata]